MLSALVFVTIRAIGPGESALVLVFYFGVTGCVVAPVLLAALQVRRERDGDGRGEQCSPRCR